MRPFAFVLAPLLIFLPTRRLIKLRWLTTTYPRTRLLAPLLALVLTLILALLCASHARAQPGAATGISAASGAPSASSSSAASTAPPTATLEALRAQLTALPDEPGTQSDYRKLLAQADDIQTQADAFVTNRTTELADLDSRLAGLGAGPVKGAPAEATDLAIQRANLQKSRNLVDADLRLARLLVVDAKQRAADLLVQRRSRFQAELSDRTDSPLGNSFWRTVAAAWPGDKARLQRLGNEVGADLSDAAEAGKRRPLMVALLLSVLMVVGGNWLAERSLVRIAPDHLPPGRLRRSLLAVAIVVANVAITGVAAQIAYAGLDWHGALGPRTRELAQDLVRLAMLVAFAVGLARALLSVRRGSWRLPPMSDAMAARLQPFAWLITLASALISLQREINTNINASLEAAVLTHGGSALLLSTLMGLLLWRLREPRATAQLNTGQAGQVANTGPAHADISANERPQWIGLAIGALGLVVVAVWLLVALGYVALASFMASQTVWAGLVGATFYLLFKFVDDLSRAIVAPNGSVGRRLQSTFNIAPALLEQAAVLLSALGRIGLFFYCVVAIMAPFGTTVGELVQRSGKFDTGIHIGEFALAPTAIFSALAVLLLGFVGLRFFRRWLAQSYFPSTTLEAGMRSSISTLLGYGGGVVVVALALSAMGIGVERIGWVASALSVGIGFGLQAIVQNFISGLILLVEQPIKVGDWVIIGDTEGDVRRINVRATEIQLGDRSTLIVPNSEFVTKTVRNMTLANAEGRVLIRLPMPLTTNANQLRSLMMGVFEQHSAVLKEPAPTVLLDGVEAGQLMFRATGYVDNPRIANQVRSELLFSVLDALASAQISLVAYAAPTAPTAPTSLTAPGTPTTAANPADTATLNTPAQDAAAPASGAASSPPATPASPLPASNH